MNVLGNHISQLILYIFLSGSLFAQTYDFNKKVSVRLKAEGEVITTYYYLNTENGNAAQDRQALQQTDLTADVSNAHCMIFIYGKSTNYYGTDEGRNYHMEVKIPSINYTASQF